MKIPFAVQDMFIEERFPAVIPQIFSWASRRLQRQPGCLVIPPIVRPFEDAGFRHWHHRPELFIQVEGDTCIRIHEAEIDVPEGSVMVVPRGVDHREQPRDQSKPCNTLVIAYAEWGIRLHSARAQHPRGQQFHALNLPACAQLYEMLDRACITANGTRDSRHPLVHGMVLAHLASLAEAAKLDDGDHASYAPKVVMTLALIHRHTVEPTLTVDWLADQVGCTADYLSNLFSTQVGSTITSYINRDRVSRARNLLRATTLNISEVARACGYTDPGYFTRQFRRLEGRPPRTFRQEQAAPS